MTSHRLVGVVTYYGKHYSTFFFHTKLQLWIYFDDATVSEVTAVRFHSNIIFFFRLLALLSLIACLHSHTCKDHLD